MIVWWKEERFVQAMSLDADDRQRTQASRDQKAASGKNLPFLMENPPQRPATADVFRPSASLEQENPRPFSDSVAIECKKTMRRDQVKGALEQAERTRRVTRLRARRQKVEQWTQKTARSPFHVNLVADNERLDEEQRVARIECTRRARDLERRAKDAKSHVILKALSESSDLELLRREKRAIIDEEKRLRALLDLEKTNAHRKLDLLAARQAERQRRQALDDSRRRRRQEELREREERYKQLLREKLALE